MTELELQRLKDEIVKHTITRAHALALSIGTIVISVATAWGAYITTISDIRSQIEINRRDVDQKLTTLRLEREQLYVKKEDLKGLTDKLDKITTDIASINGFMQAQSIHQQKK